MNQNAHSFHIPVMGLAFSLDSPQKVARYGISSVMSLSDDMLIEQVREHYSQQYERAFTPISNKEDDYRAKRITAYLNLVQDIVHQQVQELKQQDFTPASDLTKYFTLLQEGHPLKVEYQHMLQTSDLELRQQLQKQLREAVVAGNADVNIMTKLDKTNYNAQGQEFPAEYSDALAALRGFANSRARSSIVFSAGMNMRLFAYLEQFSCFSPNARGEFEKKVIIKVSDFRSALVQGKVLAKKGIWVSEFRIESGLNCGGHAFATDGYLIGPILEDFKQNRKAMQAELFGLYSAALKTKGIQVPAEAPDQRLTMQGGVGTNQEHNFLQQYYGMDAVGWGTPFLLVPEATTVDEETLQQLVKATAADLTLSNVSPLGVPFNTLRGSSNDLLKQQRAAHGKPGSPCIKKFLVSNTEFTTEPICTASRRYQRRKLEQLQAQNLPAERYQAESAKILAKECLCEGLANAAIQEYHISRKASNKAVSICPGPNLAFFSGVFKLQEMVDHIYGRFNALHQTSRPHMFINELKLYVDYWKNKKAEQLETITDKQFKYLQNFWDNLQSGIRYYKELLPTLLENQLTQQKQMLEELLEAEDELFSAQLIKEAFA